MIITCGCGNVFSTKFRDYIENVLPSRKPGSVKVHVDPGSYTCKSCGIDTYPEIQRCYREGRIKYENGATILTSSTVKKLEINND